MPAPRNHFKQALLTKTRQIGLFAALGTPETAELCAGAGFDWILIDAEHGPNDIPLIASQLRAMAGKPTSPVVRLPIGETWLIKQVLDIGAQSLLIPMVESGDQAEAMVRACRYPPQGVRGVASSMVRASDFGRIGDYLATANDEVCLVVQIESRAGIAELDAIAQTEGVDGVLIGPSDLAADMGFLGKAGASDVVSAVEWALKRIQDLGKAAGIMTTDPALARRYLDLGASFVAVGSDVGLLASATSRLRAEFAPPTASMCQGHGVEDRDNRRGVHGER